jgi:tetratricopeptide (TPR) repeat protein
MKVVSEMTHSRRIFTAFGATIAGCVLALLPIRALAQSEQPGACGPIGAPLVTIGPYDYRTERKEVAFIEGNHFQPQVQALIGGVSGTIGAELDFMLRHIPNHHKVLITLIRYGEKLKWVPAPGLRFSYECYFNRAIRFRPDDTSVRLIYATYLNKVSRTSEALDLLADAANAAGDNGFTQYNIGLIYLDMRQYDLARAQAHKARSLGFEKADLQDRLKAAGEWKEPSDPAPAAKESRP